jgi:hypothetical protein
MKTETIISEKKTKRISISRGAMDKVRVKERKNK